MYDKVCTGRGNPVCVCTDEGIQHKAFVTLMQRCKIKDFCNILKVYLRISDQIHYTTNDYKLGFNN